MRRSRRLSKYILLFTKMQEALEQPGTASARRARLFYAAFVSLISQVPSTLCPLARVASQDWKFHSQAASQGFEFHSQVA